MALSPELAVLAAAAGVIVGVLSALFGVGGGILMVPFMVLVLGRGQHVAEGTSLLVIVPTAIAGVLAHRTNDYVSFRHAALLALGGVLGAYSGASWALGLSARTLQLAFGVLMALSGIRTVRHGVARIGEERRTRGGSASAQRRAAGTSRAADDD